MTRFKMIAGERIPFTAEEETARDTEEAAWAAGAFDRAVFKLRRKRNELLAETDFYSLSDVTMSEDMTTYRQALRNLPSGLSTVDEVKAVTYPIKPQGGN